MRQSRNGLRPVSYMVGVQTKEEGFFHAFVQEGDMEEGMQVYALVETMQGEVKQLFSTDIKFEDVE